jgi:hypothetical protein
MGGFQYLGQFGYHLADETQVVADVLNRSIDFMGDTRSGRRPEMTSSGCLN